MQALAGSIEVRTLGNDFFRNLVTAKLAQSVPMCLQPDEEIRREVHDKVDQFLSAVGGRGKVHTA